MARPIKKSPIVSVFARTDTGLERAGNEDAFMVADLTSGSTGLSPDVRTHPIGERGSLMVVADGMGGAAGGEIASEMAVRTVHDALISSPSGVEVCEQLTGAVEAANERIWRCAAQNQKLSGMGATLTAVLVRSRYAYIAQVGDSRAYLARGIRIKQLTKDQSWAQALIDAGAIKPEQASTVPQNVILQALGTAPTIQVAMTMVELCKNDYLIVCSDGLSNKVEPDEIRDIAQHEPSLASACTRLIGLANDRGGEDNITVIVARFDGEELHSAADSNSITGSFKILDHGCLHSDLSTLSDKFQALAIASGEQDCGSRTLVLNCARPEPAGAPVEDASGQDTSSRSTVRSASKARHLAIKLGLLAGFLLLAAAGYFILTKIMRPSP